MGYFSDSDDGGASVKSTTTRKRVAKSKTFVVSDDDDEMDDINGNFSDDDNDSDFGLTSKKTNSSGFSKTKKTNTVTKTAAAAPKKPRAKKVATTPLSETSANEVGEEESKSLLDHFAQETDDKENNPVNGSTPKGKKDASSQYQKLTQLEHILKRPDTYIGSVEPTEMKLWVFDPVSKDMEFKDVTIVPGLYKIFDEILVNAADNKIRDPSMDILEVNIDVDTNTISIYNGGKGIPIEIHKKEKIYIPELIFGNLLTSSNYDDNEKKVTGGRNGYGAKV